MKAVDAEALALLNTQTDSPEKRESLLRDVIATLARENERLSDAHEKTKAELAEYVKTVVSISEPFELMNHWEDCDARPEDDDSSELTEADWAKCCCSAGAFRKLLLAARAKGEGKT